MNAKLVAVVLAVLTILAGGAYLFYATAHVSLSIADPPPQPYSPSITAITITFTKIEIHAAGGDNNSGWHTLMTSGSVNLLTVLNVSKVLGVSNLPAGKYDEIRFFASQAVITINGVDITYTIPSAGQTGFKVPITGGGFQVMGGLSASLQLDLAFKNSEIIGNTNLTLTPVATATVV